MSRIIGNDIDDDDGSVDEQLHGDDNGLSLSNATLLALKEFAVQKGII